MIIPKSINRRRFLRDVIGVTGGRLALPYIVTSAALGKDRGVAASERIVMGSIGQGGMGYRDMQSLMGNANVQMVAICDVDKERRERSQKKIDEHCGSKGCKTYNDFRELLGRDDIEAVSISTQDHWHALIAVAAARSGKDMYCQKPLGMTVEESQAIRDAVRRYGRVFQTGTQQRSTRNFQFACELARNGYLGKIHTVEVGAPGPYFKRTYKKPPVKEPIPDGFDYDMYLGPAPKKDYNGGRRAWPDWYLIRDYCVGFIVNWGVHHLDIANWGCPGVAEGKGELEFTGSYRNDGLTDNINDWRGEFRYESGLRMTFSDTGNPNEQGCLFRGDKGWVHVNRKEIKAEPESLLSVKLKPGDTRVYDFAGKQGSHYDNFVDCVRSRKEPLAPVEAGHKASYLGMIAEISIRLRRKLKWDFAQEQFIDVQEANRLLSAPMRSPWHL